MGGRRARPPLAGPPLARRSLGRFKALADFDWTWPKRIDRAAVEELMSLAFLKDASNVVFVGPNGVGKIDAGTEHRAPGPRRRATPCCSPRASQMLGELAALDSDSTLRRRLRRYAQPDSSW